MASYDRAASAPRQQQAGGVHAHHGENPYYEPYEVNGGPSHHPRHHHHQSTISQVREPEFFAVANPGPLGLISFAGTTFVLGFYQCGVGYVLSRPSPLPSPSSLSRITQRERDNTALQF